MGGRGASGATYRRKVQLTERVSKLDEQIGDLRREAEKAARDEMMQRMRERSRGGSAFSTRELYEMESESQKTYFTEHLAETEYGELVRERNRAKRELAMLMRGQRSMF